MREIVDVKKQYHIKPAKDHKSISCDIYARDDRGNIYIVEIQKNPHPELLERAEFYQGISVYNECALSKKLRYKEHPRCYVVFLCCFDVAKIYPTLDFPEFTRVKGCIYGEETKRLCNICNYALIEDKELQELFKFILNSDTNLHASWDVIQLLQRKVRQMKGEEDMFELLEFNEAMISDYYDEGWYDGVEEGKNVGMEKGRDMAYFDTIMRMVQDQMSVSTIAKYVDLSIPQIEQIIHSATSSNMTQKNHYIE
ncbi:MAG: Rpn family recombination-promoting nuclease/putative transposase [Erysipelotrichaceae bacterium]|nr:Rpn family recombination-promoting nuclease/putative transposase [Erysipelotrichaceae bacterium]